MDFKSYLELNAKKINLELDLILQDFLNEVKKTNIKLVPFALGLINSCKGGKRIRGVLVKLGYELTGNGLHLRGEAKMSSGPHLGGDILKIAAAFEILHTAFLIHDDIMDQSPIRRGQPSLYKALGGGHYGISQAITVGDIGLALPVKIIAQSNFLGEYKIKALEYFSQMIINTGWGQIMDVELVRGKGKGESLDFARDKRGKGEMEFVQLYKTAKYTIAGPMQIGAILAGAEDEKLGVLGMFGENLGIAFQIQDDILDGEIKEVDQAKLKALEYTSKAKKIISQITDELQTRKLLEEMCQYLVQRDK
ncbi:polyprenyl synthetase family protein [Candidatus Daviesbacteria bacterium]|nr:polyprenyl synthetase family protein [Candidatus Daviesbacteria bacterium]